MWRWSGFVDSFEFLHCTLLHWLLDLLGRCRGHEAWSFGAVTTLTYQTWLGEKSQRARAGQTYICIYGKNARNNTVVHVQSVPIYRRDVILCNYMQLYIYIAISRLAHGHVCVYMYVYNYIYSRVYVVWG